MKRRVNIIKGQEVPNEPLGTASGPGLDKIAKHFNLVRQPDEDDEHLRTRCRWAYEVSVGLYPGAFTDP